MLGRGRGALSKIYSHRKEIGNHKSDANSENLFLLPNKRLWAELCLGKVSHIMCEAIQSSLFHLKKKDNTLNIFKLYNLMGLDICIYL